MEKREGVAEFVMKSKILTLVFFQSLFLINLIQH